MIKVEGIPLKEIEFAYFNGTRLKVMEGSFEEKVGGYFFKGEVGPVFIPEGALTAVAVEHFPAE